MRPRLMLYNPTPSTDDTVKEMTSQKGKMLEVRNQGNLPLNRAKSLIKLTDSILGRDRSLAVRGAWLDELIAWADENGIPEDVFPRDADAILALTSLGLPLSFKPSYLPDSIGNLTNLRDLDLAWDNLSVLPDSIGNLANLRRLDLAWNNLSVLPDSIWSLTDLKRLDLGGNNLSALPDSIGNLTNLRGLYLGRNNLSELPDSIGGLTDLEWLYLDDNNLSILSDSIGNLTNLTGLYLEGNKFLKLPDALGKLEKLECLALSTDQVLPPSLAHLEPIISWSDPD